MHNSGSSQGLLLDPQTKATLPSPASTLHHVTPSITPCKCIVYYLFICFGHEKIWFLPQMLSFELVFLFSSKELITCMLQTWQCLEQCLAYQSQKSHINILEHEPHFLLICTNHHNISITQGPCDPLINSSKIYFLFVLLFVF